MNKSEIIKLLSFYQRALEEQNIEAIQKSLNVLEKYLPEVDQEAEENMEVLANLKRVHLNAMDFIKQQRDIAQAEMEATGNNKARDVAYQKTQLSR